MKSYILNIIALLAAIPMMISCIVDDADVNLIDSSDLTLYAKDKVATAVALPLEALEFAIELENYLALPEEDKAKNTKFSENCEELSPGLYLMNYSSVNEFRNIHCRVSTDGKSIHEEGAVWTFHEFSMHGNDFEYSSYDYNWQLPEGARIVMMSASDSTWAMNVDEMAVQMKMQPMRDSLYTWTVTAQGTEETSVGVRSEYGTKSEFSVREMMMPSGERTNSYEGLFYVDIYRNGEPVDYCHATFTYGFDSKYHTSR